MCIKIVLKKQLCLLQEIVCDNVTQFLLSNGLEFDLYEVIFLIIKKEELAQGGR